MKLLNKKLSPLLFLIFISLIIVIIGEVLQNEKEDYRKSILEENTKITLGTINELGKAGVSGSYVVEYDYYVNNKVFNRSTYSKYARYYYKKCSEPKKCNMKFLVIYSDKDPAKSLINLGREVNDTNVQFPLQFEEFE